MDTFFEGVWDKAIPAVRRAEAAGRRDSELVPMVLTLLDHVGVDNHPIGVVTALACELSHAVKNRPQ